MHIVLLDNHGNQFISQDGGDHKPRYGDYHIPGQRKNNGKDAGIPGLRRLSHFGCDCGDLAVDIAKHTRQIASDGPD